MDTQIVAIFECGDHFCDQRDGWPKIPGKTCTNRESVEARLFRRTIREISGLGNKPAIIEGIGGNHIQLRAVCNAAGYNRLEVRREVPSEVVLSVDGDSQGGIDRMPIVFIQKVVGSHELDRAIDDAW